MKHRLLIVTAFLLAGVVLNVAVAWGCALWVMGRSSFEVGQNMTLSRVERFLLVRDKKIEAGPRLMSLWKELQPPEWPPDVNEFRESVGFGLRDIFYVNYNDKDLTYLGVIKFCGWPSCSLRGSSFGSVVPPTRILTAQDGSDSLRLAGVPRRNQTDLVPLAPIWPGFAINTLFYAALLPAGRPN